MGFYVVDIAELQKAQEAYMKMVVGLGCECKEFP